MSPTHEHRCKQVGKAALLFTGIGIALCWLFNTVYAGELERRELKTKLEGMADDVAAIRTALERATSSVVVLPKAESRKPKAEAVQ